MLKQELEDEVVRLEGKLKEETALRKGAQSMLVTMEKERNTARSDVRSMESKMQLIRTSMETLAAIKFPAFGLDGGDPGYNVSEKERVEYLSEIPEHFLALKHIYSLVRSHEHQTKSLSDSFSFSHRR